MTRVEVVELFIKEKVLIMENGKYVLAPSYYPKTSKINENFENLLMLYADLWPKKIKSGNRLVKRSANSLRRKLLAFTKLRPDVSHENILTVTDMYVKSAKHKGYEYMMCADYYISKNNSSELESAVDLLLEGNLESPDAENLIRDLN